MQSEEDVGRQQALEVVACSGYCSRNFKFKCWNEVHEHCVSSQDAFDDVVKYFGENPKTTPPSVFFPVFVRFVKAYKVIRKTASWRRSCRGLGHLVPA